ncbi:MAG: hypothetical protein IID45_09165 [Planctomycetes bacterium]|nr:hypothetical protein [Planctomycetota bacterium]
MRKLSLMLIGVFTLFGGCSGKSTSRKTSKSTVSRNVEEKKGDDRKFPPAEVAHLSEHASEFANVPFDWSSLPARWDSLTRKERAAQSLGFLFVRKQYRYNTVRIREVVYDPNKLRSHWQEELRNGKWVRHGPDIYYTQDGKVEIGFRLDGEPHGKLRIYDSAGKLLEVRRFDRGIPKPE